MIQHIAVCGLYSPHIERRALMSIIASNQLDTTELELIKHIFHRLKLTSIIISNNLKGFRKIATQSRHPPSRNSEQRMKVEG